jgi:magnesium transporter
MPKVSDTRPTSELLVEVEAVLAGADETALHSLLAELHPAEVADLLESLPPARREVVWRHADPANFAEILAESDDSVRLTQLLDMPVDQLARLAERVDDDDAVDILQDLPEDVVEQVLQSLDKQDRARLEIALSYPEDTAGGLMNTDTIAVRPDVSLDVVHRYLRRLGSIPPRTNRLMVVDRDNIFVGSIRLASLLVEDETKLVSDCLQSDEEALLAELSADHVAQHFEQFNLLTAPVVDAQGRLLGRITVDDVVDVIRKQGEAQMMHMAGLDQSEDMFAPILVTARRRALWLGVNLATALLASWVIGLFENAIQTVVALAVLMPVVASMGGIAGSQALTVVVRGLALGQLARSNAVSLLWRELAVGALNSVLWALVVGAVAFAWFGNATLGVIVGVALVANLAVAAVAGAAIPLLLRRLSIDPALAGGVILTTVTDVVGFVVFLGLGSVFLM